MDIFTHRGAWDIAPYLTGAKVYGDNFTSAQLKRWYAEEEYAYYQLVQSHGIYDVEEGKCLCAALNLRLFGAAVAGRHFGVCLGFGSAGGEELTQFAPQVERFEIVEPADQWHKTCLAGKPAHYCKPDSRGTLPYADNTVDLIVCLSTLHHVANVSYVLGEFARVLAPGGLLLLREPLSSMGDWRFPRPGLTPNERGFPLHWLVATLAGNGLSVTSRKLCVFRPLEVLFRRVIAQPYMSRSYVWLDALLSWLFGWNLQYHRTRWWHKIAPGAVGLVAVKTR